MQTEPKEMPSMEADPGRARPQPPARPRLWRFLPRALVGLYPPFLGAGIGVRANGDLSVVESRLKWRWWNRNYVGTHFGGSIYAMTDPFYMVMLIERLGTSFTVWLAEASIRYVRPGRGELRARFELSEAQLADIRARAQEHGRTQIELPVRVLDGRGEVVAEVRQVLYVRAKGAMKTFTRTGAQEQAAPADRQELSS
jgi:acyl-coenzyme A thioesterase PaaI-like protein